MNMNKMHDLTKQLELKQEYWLKEQVARRNGRITTVYQSFSVAVSLQMVLFVNFHFFQNVFTRPFLLQCFLLFPQSVNLFCKVL